MVTQNSSLADLKALTLRVAMTSGHYFFCRRVELPSDLEKGEEGEVVLLELESLSPFPLEHMNYGYRVDEGRKFAFVYAAYKKRFADGEMGKWSQVDAALPDFSLALIGAQKGKAPLLCLTEHSVSYFEYDDRSELPAYSFSKELVRDENGVSGSAEDQLAAMKGVLNRVIDENALRIWNLDSEIAVDGEDLRLVGRRDEEGEFSESISRSEIWSMDIRDDDVVETAKISHRRNLVLWKAVQGMAVLFLLLVLGEAIWGGVFGYLSSRTGENKTQQVRVDKIDEQRNTINELLNYQESNLTPFAMLKAIDSYRYRNGVRADANHQIRYTKVETRGVDTLVIDAECSQTNHQAAFKDRLSKFDLVESIDFEKERSDQKGTRFTAIVKFRSGAFVFYEENPTRVASQ